MNNDQLTKLIVNEVTKSLQSERSTTSSTSYKALCILAHLSKDLDHIINYAIRLAMGGENVLVWTLSAIDNFYQLKKKSISISTLDVEVGDENSFRLPNYNLIEKIIFGGFSFEYPAFTTWSDIDRGTLFPILFITIASGACSGFHSIVASGTTSKQLNCETDARKIGYGAMLIEGLVAVISLFTVAMLVRNDDLVNQAPLVVFGTGMGNFLSIMGIPFEVGMSFGILAVSTFLLTTLDTSTRLARYILEELFNITNPSEYSARTLSYLTYLIIYREIKILLEIDKIDEVNKIT